jgi:hypothetical protein
LGRRPAREQDALPEPQAHPDSHPDPRTETAFDAQPPVDAAIPPRDTAQPAPSVSRTILCPYCGHIGPDQPRCERCNGRFEPLSRQATQNAMGPWFVLDERVPTRPGASYDTIRQMASRGTLKPDTVLRGPSTYQFWMQARRVPGVAHLLGVCHACQAPARPDEYQCRSCGERFDADRDRQHLGLGAVRPLPGQSEPAQVLAHAAGRHWKPEGVATPPTPKAAPAPVRSEPPRVAAAQGPSVGVWLGAIGIVLGAVLLRLLLG